MTPGRARYRLMARPNRLRVRARHLSLCRRVALGMAGALLWPFGAHGQDRLPPVAVEAPSLSEMAPVPRNEAEAGGYHIAVIAAGAVVGVMGANFMTGGLITPLLAAGTGTAMATAPGAASGLGST